MKVKARVQLLVHNKHSLQMWPEVRGLKIAACNNNFEKLKTIDTIDTVRKRTGD